MDPEICLEVVKYRDLPSGAAGRTVLAVFLRTEKKIKLYGIYSDGTLADTYCT